MYQIIWGLRKTILSKDYIRFKTEAQLFIPVYKITETDKVEMEFDIYDNWHTKDGNIKKRDVQNLTKALIDAVCSKLRFDDSQVWKETTSKKEGEKRGVELRLWKKR